MIVVESEMFTSKVMRCVFVFGNDDRGKLLMQWGA